MASRIEDGVQLPPGLSGSRFLHGVLHETAATFPDVFSGVRLPTGKAFKKGYGDAVVRFEAARAASPQRAEVARFMTRRLHEQLHFRTNGASFLLREHLTHERAASPLKVEKLSGTPGLVPEVPFDGRVYRGAEVAALVATLRERSCLTDRAAAGLAWTLAEAERQGGTLDLSGHRFAILGAGAELAPTLDLLRAGATVLWIDLADPHEVIAGDGGAPLAGTLVTAPGVTDILKQPAEIAAAIRAFAADGPVHLGLFAYAPGRGRELRLAGAMDAIARSLPAEAIASVGMYISPTTPATVQPEDRDASTRLLRAQNVWKSALTRVRALSPRPHHHHGEVAIARAVVPLQGPGYQAAQYLAKMATAETWATHGSDIYGEAAKPMTVSANVAGISKTRSIEHPLFTAAFIGAPSVGVQIFDVPTTRALSGLLMLHDILAEDAPGAATSNGVSSAQKAAQTLSQQIHGGVYSQPWYFESTIRTAAVLGLAKRPSLLIPKR
ncbi:MAG: hypothetical protein EP329_13265 [Deltaproteobacteria bacterium]|nr:MAG: hypothetical protein EP329_13265 [Deltaproteobacteria bacterium]